MKNANIISLVSSSFLVLLLLSISTNPVTDSPMEVSKDEVEEKARAVEDENEMLNNTHHKEFCTDTSPHTFTSPDNDNQQDDHKREHIAVIGCGPGGMFILHALATKRKQLQDANDIEGLKKLPIITVFERSSVPGGVWASAMSSRNNASSTTTNMYEGLWINAHKGAFEFPDYTFEEHFKGKPQPVYLPRKRVIEYLIARVTKHEDIFQHVQFNTEVSDVWFDKDKDKFEIEIKNLEGGNDYHQFDRCIWAAGDNGEKNIPQDTMNALRGFKGDILHSSEVDKVLGGSDANGVEGKRVLMIGDSYSTEDLTLQFLKLGVKDVHIISRSGSGSASWIPKWPGQDQVHITKFVNVTGVKDNGTSSTITFRPNKYADEYGTHHTQEELELDKVDMIIFCTGYVPNDKFLDDNVDPPYDEDRVWSLNEFGVSSKDWTMKENSLRPILGHVEPSKMLKSNSYWYHVEEVYFRETFLIDDPRMMYMNAFSNFDLFSLDIRAWLIKAYITGEKSLPTKEEMTESSKMDRLESMHDISFRLEADDNYAQRHEDVFGGAENLTIIDNIPCKEYFSHHLNILARDMNDGCYPVTFGNFTHLNDFADRFLSGSCHDFDSRYLSDLYTDESSKWRTFRDVHPSRLHHFKSQYTGMDSVPLKGRWLDIDNDGNRS